MLQLQARGGQLVLGTQGSPPGAEQRARHAAQLVVDQALAKAKAEASLKASIETFEAPLSREPTMLPQLSHIDDALIVDVEINNAEDMDNNLESKVHEAMAEALHQHGLQPEELDTTRVEMKITDQGGRSYKTKDIFEKAFPGGPPAAAFPMHAVVSYAKAHDRVVVDVRLDSVVDMEENLDNKLRVARESKAKHMHVCLGTDALSMAVTDSVGRRFNSREALETAYPAGPSQKAFPMHFYVAYRKVTDSAEYDEDDHRALIPGSSKPKYFAPRFIGSWRPKEHEPVRISGNNLCWPGSRGKRRNEPVPIEPVDEMSFIMCGPTGRPMHAELHAGLEAFGNAYDELHWEDGEVWTRVVARRPSKLRQLYLESKPSKSMSTLSKAMLSIVGLILVLLAWGGTIAIFSLPRDEEGAPAAVEPTRTPGVTGNASTTERDKAWQEEVERLKGQLDAAKREAAVATAAKEAHKLQAKEAMQKAAQQQQEAEYSKRQADAARKDAAEAAKEAQYWRKAAKEAMSKPSITFSGQFTHFMEWLGNLPLQPCIAVLAGAVGVLSVMGPSTFVRFFLALCGSTAGGLLVASCASFFVDRNGGSDVSGSLVAAMLSLVEGCAKWGSGEHLFIGYVMWGLFLLLGMARWATGFECALYAVVDDLKMSQDGNLIIDDRDLRLPLVANQAPNNAVYRVTRGFEG